MTDPNRTIPAEDDDTIEHLREIFAPLAYENTVGTGWLERCKDVPDPISGSVSGRNRAARGSGT